MTLATSLAPSRSRARPRALRAGAAAPAAGAPLVIQQDGRIARVPDWVRDLATFRRWATSDDFPTRGWYAFLDGELWVDPSMERMAHNQVKGEFARVLSNLVIEAASGRFFHDRMLLTNVAAGLSTEPDGMFLSFPTLQSGQARLSEGEDSLEVEGTPDIVLEVVSPSSVQKDTVVLRNLYWRAGVREYWLADPRRDDVALDILRRGPKGYVATRRQGGWLKSAVFDKSFRLTRRGDALGYPAYTLAVR